MTLLEALNSRIKELKAEIKEIESKLALENGLIDRSGFYRLRNGDVVYISRIVQALDYPARCVHPKEGEMGHRLSGKFIEFQETDFDIVSKSSLCEYVEFVKNLFSEGGLK